MALKTIILGLGIFSCFVSALLLAYLQVRKAVKGGIYVSVFQALNAQEISRAKFAGCLFLAGSILVVGLAQ